MEGATDFLWMLLVALLTRFVGDPVCAALALGVGFVVATLVLFGAVVLLLALRERRYFAVAALLVLAWASADGFRSDHRRGGFGIASGLILALWLLSGLVAFAAAHFDLF